MHACELEVRMHSTMWAAMQAKNLSAAQLEVWRHATHIKKWLTHTCHTGPLTSMLLLVVGTINAVPRVPEIYTYVFTIEDSISRA